MSLRFSTSIAPVLAVAICMVQTSCAPGKAPAQPLQLGDTAAFWPAPWTITETPYAAAPGGPLDIPCVEPAASYAAPIVWTVSNQMWLDFADWFDASPYDTRAGPVGRVVHDLASHEGRLYVGVGDMDHNTGSLFCPHLGGPCPYADADGHGTPVYTFSVGDDASTWESVVEEEAVKRFRRLGDSLYIPGIDPSRGDPRPECAKDDAPEPCEIERDREHPRFERGHVSMHRQGLWYRSPALQTTYHIFDLMLHRGVLYAAGSGIERPDNNGSDSTIWRSDNGGSSWIIEQVDRNKEGFHHDRFWLLVPAGDQLYALGARTLTDPDQAESSMVTSGDGWEPAPGFLAGFSQIANAEPFSDSQTFVFGPWPEEARVLGAVVTADRTPENAADLLPFFSTREPADATLVCREDLLVLSRSRATAESEFLWTWEVHHTTDLARYTRVAAWDSDVLYSALAVWDDALILGDYQGRLHRLEAL